MSQDYKYPGLDAPEPHSKPATPDSMHTNFSILILSLALSVFFGSQIQVAVQQKEMQKIQLQNLDKQKENLAKAKEQMTELVARRDESVKGAQAIQKNYVDLFNDVLDLAKDEPAVAEIVGKYGIKRDANQAPAGKPEEAKPAEAKKP